VEGLAAAKRESPDSRPPVSRASDRCRNTHGNGELEKRCKQIEQHDRKRQEDAAWSTHEQQVLGPIRDDVMRALESYARTHGIDLLLDRHELARTLLVVAASADITTAFIKNYNAASKAGPTAR
jgi:Skp family chaperone for outer membrane proteins